MGVLPSKIMTYDDIKVGDRIRVVDVRNITVTKAGMDAEVYGEHGVKVMRESMIPGTTREFHLVERPIAPLPETPGSVISIQDKGVPDFIEKWVLVEESAKNWRHVWINVANGTRLSPNFLRSRVAARGGFEVIS